MRLYYLTKLDTAKVILNERRMKLSRLREVNDPFELLGASIGGKLARRVFKVVLHTHWSETLGMIASQVLGRTQSCGLITATSTTVFAWDSTF